MTYTPCHESFEPGPMRTAELSYGCGRCGGDVRHVIEANREAVAAQVAALRERARLRWEQDRRAVALAAHHDRIRAEDERLAALRYA